MFDYIEVDPDEDIKAELRAQAEAARRLLRNHLEHPPGDPERVERDEELEELGC